MGRASVDEEDPQVGDAGGKTNGEGVTSITTYGMLVGRKEGTAVEAREAAVEGGITANDDDIRRITGGKLCRHGELR